MLLATGLPAAAQQIMYTYAVQPVALPAFSDEDLDRTVREALAEDDLLKGTSIEVLIVDGRVVLSGIALTRAQVLQARALAENAVGVERVAEPRIEVPGR